MSAGVRPSVERRPAFDATRSDLTDDFDCACVLQLLSERPGGSRELCERLRTLGLAQGDPARVERTLRALERTGLVSAGEHDAPVVRERTYRATSAGVERLAIAADDLSSTRVLLERFLARCSERLVV